MGPSYALPPPLRKMPPPKGRLQREFPYPTAIFNGN